MTKKNPIKHNPPYELFRQNGTVREDKLDEFFKKCHKCAHSDGELRAFNIDCEIWHALADSIVNQEVRWEEKWVHIEDGFPVCDYFEEVS